MSKDKKPEPDKKPQPQPEKKPQRQWPDWSNKIDKRPPMKL